MFFDDEAKESRAEPICRLVTAEKFRSADTPRHVH